MILCVLDRPDYLAGGLGRVDAAYIARASVVVTVQLWYCPWQDPVRLSVSFCYQKSGSHLLCQPLDGPP